MSLARLTRASLLAASCVFACASGFVQVAFAQVLQSVPAFDLESVDGTRLTSKALEGKVVLVDFWATWCQPCIEEIPHSNELYTRYQSKGLVVVGGIWGFPTTFLVNRKGQIYKKYTGTYPQKQTQIEADIQKLLAEKP